MSILGQHWLPYSRALAVLATVDAARSCITCLLTASTQFTPVDAHIQPLFTGPGLRKKTKPSTAAAHLSQSGRLCVYGNIKMSVKQLPTKMYSALIAAYGGSVNTDGVDWASSAAPHSSLEITAAEGILKKVRGLRLLRVKDQKHFDLSP